MIWELLQTYTTAIFCAWVSSLALSRVGVHLAARDLSLKTLVMGQGANVGILLGLLLAHHQEWLVLLIGSGFAALIYFAEDYLLSLSKAGKASILLGAFILLSALSHGLVSYFPGLESHATQAFFGDLVTVSGFRLWLCLLVAAVIWLVIRLKEKSITRETFQQAIYLKEDLSQNAKTIFVPLAFTLMIVSIFALGLIFTLGAMLIPTLALNLFGGSNLKRHFIFCQLGAALGTLIGFAVSLAWENFSTVPTVCFCILAASLLLGILGRSRQY